MTRSSSWAATASSSMQVAAPARGGRTGVPARATCSSSRRWPGWPWWPSAADLVSRRGRRGDRRGDAHADHALAGDLRTVRSTSSTRRWWCRRRPGSIEADVAMVLQAVLDRHAMLRLRVDRRWSLYGARGRARWTPVTACASVRRDCPDAGGGVSARSLLNPAAGTRCSARWAATSGELALIVHHLAVDGVSWRILLEDINIAWREHRAGQLGGLAPTGHLVPAVGRRCSPSIRTVSGR